MTYMTVVVVVRVSNKYLVFRCVGDDDDDDDDDDDFSIYYRLIFLYFKMRPMLVCLWVWFYSFGLLWREEAPSRRVQTSLRHYRKSRFASAMMIVAGVMRRSGREKKKKKKS